MHKKFLTGLLYSLVSNLGIKALWILVIEVAVQRAVGTNAYGSYFSAFNFSFLLVMLLDLGLTNFNTRNIAQHRQLLAKHFPPLAAIKALLGVVYMLIAAGIGFASGFRGEIFYVLLLMSGVQVFVSFNMYLRSNISALLYFKLDAVLGVLDRLILILVIGAWLLTDLISLEFTILTYAAAQFCSSLLSFLAALIVNFRVAGFYFPKKVRWGFYMMILRKSLPFALLILLMSIYVRVDAVLMNWMLSDGDRAAGVYAASFRLFDAFSQVAILFSGILLPIFADLFKQKEKVSSIMNIGISLLGATTFIVSLAGFYFPQLISQALYNERQEEIAQVMQVYVPGLFFYSISLITGTLLTAKGEIRLLNYIALGGALFNILLNLLLIPHYKEIGSAYTALTTFALVAALQLYFSIRRTDFTLSSRLMMRFLFFICAVSASGYVLQQSKLGEISAFFCFLAVAGMAALLTRVIHLKEMIRILRGKMG